MIALPQVEGVHDSSSAEDAFEIAYQSIVEDKPLTCGKTGTTFDAHPVRPTVAILDVRQSLIVNRRTLRIDWFGADFRDSRFRSGEEAQPKQRQSLHMVPCSHQEHSLLLRARPCAGM